MSQSLPLVAVISLAAGAAAARADRVPPSWKVLPVPRCVNYGPSKSFITIGNAAIVRAPGSPYETVRDDDGELVGLSTITEEELTAILHAAGLDSVTSVPDNLASYADYDTLFVLGAPRHNQKAADAFAAMKLAIGKYDDRNTPEDDFTDWPDLGPEGYALKVGRLRGQSIVLLAGYDYDDVRDRFHGAGTFYALQSLRQLIVGDGEAAKIKTATIVDRPLIAVRGSMTGFSPDEAQQWRDIELIPRIKANQNVYWYGNAIVGYNSEAAGKFRYPWRPDQLEAFAKFGKYCRERFVTMVFCMNPDHYRVDWAAAKTFDGTEKDPLHYDPAYEAEPEFRQMWADLGYDATTDVDILAAKFAQLHEAVPGAIVQVMNEDDLFGLVHESDKAVFGTYSGDGARDSIDYGKARGQLLIRLYRRMRELCPDGADVIPLCPPGMLCYQHVLDRDEAYSREFMASLAGTLDEAGLLEKMPLMTTGGGTAAEVITAEQIDNFAAWCKGAPVLLHDNNFPAGFRVGAYETDPDGPRFAHQVNERYPAGYRSDDLYKRLWGIVWNGQNDQHALAWCQGQFMWNMLAVDRERINELAARKVTTGESYGLVKSFFEEFDNPGCYLPDCQPPYRVKTISDTVGFPAEAWSYDMAFTDANRLACRRLRDKLSLLIPRLEVEWENEFERAASLKSLGYPALTFAEVYLAYGYMRGWDDQADADLLEGHALRDLHLRADDIQERYFAGPKEAPGRPQVDHNYYSGHLHFLYTDGDFKPPPKTPDEATLYIDIWQEALDTRFYRQILATPADDDPEVIDGATTIDLGREVAGASLIRVKIGTDATDTSQSTLVTFSAGDLVHEDAVCKPRWINWIVPPDTVLSSIEINTDGPARIYALDVYAAAVP